MVFSFPILAIPQSKISAPAKMVEGNKNSIPPPGPFFEMNGAIILANPPVKPLIIPGLPPKTAVLSPTIQAEWIDIEGSIFPMKA